MAKGHERGFGLIPNTAIDQHVFERHRELDFEQVIAARPRLLGIGIDPNVFIVVHGDQFEVIGTGRSTSQRLGIHCIHCSWPPLQPAHTGSNLNCHRPVTKIRPVCELVLIPIDHPRRTNGPRL